MTTESKNKNMDILKTHDYQKSILDDEYNIEIIGDNCVKIIRIKDHMKQLICIDDPNNIGTKIITSHTLFNIEYIKDILKNYILKKKYELNYNNEGKYIELIINPPYPEDSFIKIIFIDFNFKIDINHVEKSLYGEIDMNDLLLITRMLFTEMKKYKIIEDNKEITYEIQYINDKLFFELPEIKEIDDLTSTNTIKLIFINKIEKYDYTINNINCFNILHNVKQDMTSLSNKNGKVLYCNYDINDKIVINIKNNMAYIKGILLPKKEFIPKINHQIDNIKLLQNLIKNYLFEIPFLTKENNLKGYMTFTFNMPHIHAVVIYDIKTNIIKNKNFLSITPISTISTTNQFQPKIFNKDISSIEQGSDIKPFLNELIDKFSEKYNTRLIYLGNLYNEGLKIEAHANYLTEQYMDIYKYYYTYIKLNFSIEIL